MTQASKQPDSEATNAIDLAAFTLDQLATATVGLRQRLESQIRDAAQRIRDARTGVILPEDTYALARQLMGAADALAAIGAAFTAAAKVAKAEVGVDYLETQPGEDPPRGMHRVPDAAGDIEVRPKWERRRTFDASTLAGAIVTAAAADMVAAYLGRAYETHRGRETVEWAATGAAEYAVSAMFGMGKWEPQTSKLAKWRADQARAGRDGVAALAAAAESVTDVWTGDVEVTRAKLAER